MPTGRGWGVAVTGIAVWAAGRAFGSEPLEQLGFAFVVLLLISVAVVRLGRHELKVARRLVPARPTAGQAVQLDLHIKNAGRGPAPLVLLEENLPRGLSGNARFAVQGIEARGARSVSVTLTPARRGRYEVGPLSMSFIDPFGLARIRSARLDRSSLLVYPRVEPLALPRDMGERRSIATSALRQPTVARGEDFFTLREYASGDDLRKVHWPSTAKRGRFMIRQEETPWHTRATIVLDDRRAAHDGTGPRSSFERAVEAAASFVDLYHRSGYGFRLVGAHEQGLPSGRGADHLARTFDLLALIEKEDQLGDDSLILRFRELEESASAEASLVALTGTLSPEAAIGLTRCRKRFRQVIAVMFPDHRFGLQHTKARWAGEESLREVSLLLERGGVRALSLGPEESLAAMWSSSQHRASGRARSWGPKPERV